MGLRVCPFLALHYPTATARGHEALELCSAELSLLAENSEVTPGDTAALQLTLSPNAAFWAWGPPTSLAPSSSCVTT